MSTAADLRFARAGLSPTARYPKDDDAALDAFEDSSFLPSFLEAADLLLGHWAAEGAAGRAVEAIARARRAGERFGLPPVTDGVFTYFAARPGTASAEEAVKKLRVAGSPPWLDRALRLRS